MRRLAAIMAMGTVPVSAAPTNDLLQGLVSYWKLDETSGTRNDSKGTNHLSDNGGTTATGGVLGNCAYFQKTTLNNYLSCTSNSTLQMASNTDFTFAFWAQLTNNTVTSSLITKDDDAANSRDYTIDYSSGLRFYIKGGGTYITTPSVASLGVWYFVVAWYDSSNGQLHLRVNDTTTLNSSTGATGTDVSAAQFRIGAREYAGFEDYAAAFLDEVGMWKRLLSSEEITMLYASGVGFPYSSFGLATAMDSYSETNQDSVFTFGATGGGTFGSTTEIGQCFTGNGKKITNAKFYARQRVSPTGNAVARIWTMTGTFGVNGTTGTLLATSDNFNVSTLGASFALTTFTFTGAQRYQTVNGTNYVVTVQYLGGTSTNTVDLGYDGSSGTHPGTWTYYDGTWHPSDAGIDFIFYVDGV